MIQVKEANTCFPYTIDEDNCRVRIIKDAGMYLEMKALKFGKLLKMSLFYGAHNKLNDDIFY